MMKICSILILFIGAFACRPRGKTWQVLDFGAFKLRTPVEWRIVKRQSIDSYVGGLTNGVDSIWFDYGRYGVDLHSDSGYWYRFTEDTVNGYRAILSVSESLSPGEVSMKIPQLDSGSRFAIWASRVRDSATIIQIFKTAMFVGSDSSKNLSLSGVRKFERTNVNGEAVFVSDCEACHTVKGSFEGPSIQELVGRRSADWLYRFFTDPDFRVHDRFHQQLKKAFNDYDCAEIDKMTKEEAVAVFYYIRAQP